MLLIARIERMGKKKPRKSKLKSRQGAISDHAVEWIGTFIRVFEDNFTQIGSGLPPGASTLDVQEAAIDAIIQTLFEAGVSAESCLQGIRRAMNKGRSSAIEWNAELNRRRFELIDKEFNESLTQEEQIELAGLTQLMREQLDTELNLPLAGATELYRKLLDHVEDQEQ